MTSIRERDCCDLGKDERRSRNGPSGSFGSQPAPKSSSAVPAGRFGSAGHLATRLGTAAAGRDAALAVRHVVGTAFLGTPVADVRAQLAELLGERTVASDCVAAEPADRRALDTACGTGIGAGLAGHMCEAVATFGRAVITRGDAILGSLVQMFTHGESPSVVVGQVWRARDASCIPPDAGYFFCTILTMATIRKRASNTLMTVQRPFPAMTPFMLSASPPPITVRTRREHAIAHPLRPVPWRRAVARGQARRVSRAPRGSGFEPAR
jgi:hypothetical protein